MTCDWCWGTHGCDRVPDHPGTVHTCLTDDGPCSQYDSARWLRRDWDDEEDQWTNWSAHSGGFQMEASDA